MTMTRTAIKGLALAFFALGVAWPAQAQGVWRCGGNAYGVTPCPDGRAVEAADARSHAEVQAAREIAQREARALDRLLAERRAREAEALATTVYYGARREPVRPSPRAATGPALSPRSVSVNPPKRPKAQHSQTAPTQAQQAQQAQQAKQAQPANQAKRPPPAAARTLPAAAAASRGARG
jgi:hypothetical protein